MNRENVCLFVCLWWRMFPQDLFFLTLQQQISELKHKSEMFCHDRQRTIITVLSWTRMKTSHHVCSEKNMHDMRIIIFLAYNENVYFLIIQRVNFRTCGEMHANTHYAHTRVNQTLVLSHSHNPLCCIQRQQSSKENSAFWTSWSDLHCFSKWFYNFWHFIPHLELFLFTQLSALLGLPSAWIKRVMLVYNSYGHISHLNAEYSIKYKCIRILSTGMRAACGRARDVCRNSCYRRTEWEQKRATGKQKSESDMEGLNPLQQTNHSREQHCKTTAVSERGRWRQSERERERAQAQQRNTLARLERRKRERESELCCCVRTVDTSPEESRLQRVDMRRLQTRVHLWIRDGDLVEFKPCHWELLEVSGWRWRTFLTEYHRECVNAVFFRMDVIRGDVKLAGQYHLQIYGSPGRSEAFTAIIWRAICQTEIHSTSAEDHWQYWILCDYNHVKHFNFTIFISTDPEASSG